MIDNRTVFGLRTEEDNLGINAHSHRMPGRPIKKFSTNNRLLRSIRIRNGNLSLNHVSPMRGLAEI